MLSVIPGSEEPLSVNTQATGSKDMEDNESSSTKPDEEPVHTGKSHLTCDQAALKPDSKNPSRGPLPPFNYRRLGPLAFP